nr:hypothetical protein [Tanacetum cinerariifolium]
MLIAIVKGTNHVECPPEERHIIITKNEKHQLQCLSNVCNEISERPEPYSYRFASMYAYLRLIGMQTSAL